MDWMGLKQEHRLLIKDIRKFADTEVAPLVRNADTSAEVLQMPLQKLAEIGVTGIIVPEEFGGVGMDFLSLLVTAEELAKVSPSLSLSVSMHNLYCYSLLQFTSDEFKKEYLPDFASGKQYGGFAVETVNSTPAEKDRKEGIIVNGTFASAFGFFRNDSEKQSFIVQTNSEGLKKLNEIMGFRSSGICSFYPRDVSIEKSIELDSHSIELFLARMRLIFGAIACGISSASFNNARSYAKERYQFGRPIAEFGMIREMLTDMYIRVNASELMIFNSSLNDDISTSIMSGIFAVENSLYVTDKGVQIYGGYGYTKDYPQEMFFRDAKVLEVFIGSSDYQKVKLGQMLTS